MNDYNKKWFYLAILSLIWGSSFILIKKGLVGLNSVQLASLRMIFAALDGCMPPLLKSSPIS